MKAGQRPIAKVYKAFFKAGRDNESGETKESFLEALKASGVDIAKTSSARLAAFLRGKLKMEELEHPMQRSLQAKRPALAKPHLRQPAFPAAERKRLEIVFEVEPANTFPKRHNLPSVNPTAIPFTVTRNVGQPMRASNV